VLYLTETSTAWQVNPCTKFGSDRSRCLAAPIKNMKLEHNVRLQFTFVVALIGRYPWEPRSELGPCNDVITLKTTKDS